MKKLLLSTVAIIALASSASAADLAARPYTKAPAMAAPLYNWTGFYIGAMAGYGWSDSQGVDFQGGFGGGTIGYNWQVAPNWVFGIEGELAGADIGQSAGVLGLFTVDDSIQAFGSVTGRLGYTWGPGLLYVKGGYAAANNEISITAGGAAASDSQTHSGYTIGGGLEYMFAPSWSVKGEYLFAHYQSENYFGAVVPGGAASGDFDVHTVKVGINYHINWGAPLVAKY